MASSSSSLNSHPHLNLEVVSEALKESSLFDMLNEYVLSHLFSFLRVNDIKNCRLVSSVWNQAALKAIPKIAHVVRIPCRVEKLRKLINLISSSPQFPWTNFEVDVFDVEVNGDKELCAKLFEIVAPFATGIWIEKLAWPLFTEVFTYPALKHLRLNYRDAKAINPNFGLAIVENAPNLDMLDLRGLKITDHALNLLQTSNGQKITRLVLRSVMEDQHLVRLIKVDLHLKYLSLQFRSFTEDLNTGIGPESLKALFESQRAHLKVLELSDTDEDLQTNRNFCGHSFIRVEFPRMDKLTELKISAFNANYHDICFSTLFPILRKLEFGAFDTAKFIRNRDVFKSFLKSDMAPIETVEELKLNFVWMDLCISEDCQLILDAAKQFPNLKKIHIPNNKALLDCVFMSMANVKELWLLYSDEDLNANLTGLSSAACEKVAKLPESQLKSWEEKWEPPRYFRDITKLGLVAEELWVGKRCWYDLQLTEIGCRFGLFKMERLESLELIGEISDKLLSELRSKFKVEIQGNRKERIVRI